MPNIVAALSVIFAGAVGVGDVAGPSSPLKCEPRVGGDSGMPETVVIIDHQPLDVDPSEWNHTDYDIRWVEVVCWSWVEEYYGVHVRSGAIYVVTDEGLGQTRKGQIANLDALMAAQDRHLRTHAVYARSIEGLMGVGVLSEYNLPEYFEIHLEETADGWGARVEPTERWLAGFRGSVPVPPCYVFVGTPPDDWDPIPAADRRALTERQPLCIDPFHQDEVGSDSG